MFGESDDLQLIFKTLIEYGIKKKALNGIVDVHYEDLLKMRQTDGPINPSDYDDNPIDLKTDDIKFGFESTIGPLTKGQGLMSFSPLIHNNLLSLRKRQMCFVLVQQIKHIARFHSEDFVSF